ncbi:MAG: hypothetical protein K2G49_11595 [Muribaculum sp.]|nr:hypothetical protein [Muribaculum sp.]
MAGYTGRVGAVMSLCCMAGYTGRVGAVMSLCCMGGLCGSVGALMSLCCMAVRTGSVGASGSSPACLQCRGHLRLRIACGGGRPSSRPYSYAVERWCDLQCIIMDCPCRYIVGIDVIFNAPSWIVHAAAPRCWFYFQCIINNCSCRQCRGEWKLARVATGDDVYVVASPEGMI